MLYNFLSLLQTSYGGTTRSGVARISGRGADIEQFWKLSLTKGRKAKKKKKKNLHFRTKIKMFIQYFLARDGGGAGAPSPSPAYAAGTRVSYGGQMPPPSYATALLSTYCLISVQGRRLSRILGGGGAEIIVN